MYYFSRANKHKKQPFGAFTLSSMKKKCTLVNGEFSWRLEVDGQIIIFSGSDAADYFEKHYYGLGYEIERKDENK